MICNRGTMHMDIIQQHFIVLYMLSHSMCCLYFYCAWPEMTRVKKPIIYRSFRLIKMSMEHKWKAYIKHIKNDCAKRFVVCNRRVTYGTCHMMTGNLTYGAFQSVNPANALSLMERYLWNEVNLVSSGLLFVSKLNRNINTVIRWL